MARDNNFWSVSPVKFTTNTAGEIDGWKQTLRRVVPEESPHWRERQHGRFRREDVSPCNEGFPGLVRIGPTDGGWPMIFDVVLDDGTKSRALVSDQKIEGQPSWLLLDHKRNRSTPISYYRVAGWSTPGRGDRDLFDKVLEWVIIHLPGGRR